MGGNELLSKDRQSIGSLLGKLNELLSELNYQRTIRQLVTECLAGLERLGFNESFAVLKNGGDNETINSDIAPEGLTIVTGFGTAAFHFSKDKTGKEFPDKDLLTNYISEKRLAGMFIVPVTVKGETAAVIFINNCHNNDEPYLEMLSLLGTYLSGQAEKLCEIEKLTEDNEDFTYIISHDLKAPVRGIGNYTNFIIEDHSESLNDDGKDKLTTLRALCVQLNEMIDSLLNLSRLNKYELVLEKYAVRDIAEKAAENVQLPVTTVLKIAGGLPEVICDYEKMVQLFSELIRNAEKFNDKGQKIIEVGVVDRESRPVFFVRDNGIGIRSSQYDKVFQVFKRLHGRDRYGGGTGTGLTFAKKIIEKHGGKIWLESIYGEGTTFYFSLD